MNAKSLYRSGDLDAAVNAGAQELRAAPASADKRVFLTELLCIQGHFERAETQLETLLALEPRSLVTVGTWRNLLQAATARHDVFSRNGAPDIIGPVSPRIRALLDVLLGLREDRSLEEQVAQLEAERQPTPCTINGEAYDDLRDVDDRFSSIVELLATNGKYFWVEQSDIVSLHFEAPARALDLLWRKAEIVLTSGTTGQVFLPAVYPTPTENAEQRLGRSTDWQDHRGVAVGVGQRLWMAGDSAFALTDIEHVVFGH